MWLPNTLVSMVSFLIRIALIKFPCLVFSSVVRLLLRLSNDNNGSDSGPVVLYGLIRSDVLSGAQLPARMPLAI